MFWDSSIGVVKTYPVRKDFWVGTFKALRYNDNVNDLHYFLPSRSCQVLKTRFQSYE